MCYNNSKQIQLSSAYNGMGISVSTSHANDTSLRGAAHRRIERAVAVVQRPRVVSRGDTFKQNTQRMGLSQDPNKEAPNIIQASHHNDNLGVDVQNVGEQRSRVVEQQTSLACPLACDSAAQPTCSEKQTNPAANTNTQQLKQAEKGVEQEVAPTHNTSPKILQQKYPAHAHLRKVSATAQLKRGKDTSWLTPEREPLSFNDHLHIQLDRLSFDQFAYTTSKEQISPLQLKSDMPSMNLVLSRKCAENMHKGKDSEGLAPGSRQAMRQLLSDKRNTMSHDPKPPFKRPGREVRALE